MKMTPLFPAIVALLMAPAGSTPAQEGDAAQEVRAATEALASAITRGDAEAAVAVYAADAVQLGPKDVPLRGRDQIRRIFPSPDRASMTASFEAEELRVSEDMVVVWGAMRVTARRPDSGEVIVDQVRSYVHVFEKQADGGWKLAVDIYNHR